MYTTGNGNTNVTGVVSPLRNTGQFIHIGKSPKSHISGENHISGSAVLFRGNSGNKSIPGTCDLAVMRKRCPKVGVTYTSLLTIYHIYISAHKFSLLRIVPVQRYILQQRWIPAADTQVRAKNGTARMNRMTEINTGTHDTYSRLRLRSLSRWVLLR